MNECDVEIANKEFVDTIASCYIYLTRNGLKSDYVENMLISTLKDTIQEIKRGGGWVQ